MRNLIITVFFFFVMLLFFMMSHCSDNATQSYLDNQPSVDYHPTYDLLSVFYNGTLSIFNDDYELITNIIAEGYHYDRDVFVYTSNRYYQVDYDDDIIMLTADMESVLPVYYDINSFYIYDGNSLASKDWNHELKIGEVDKIRIWNQKYIVTKKDTQMRIYFIDDDEIKEKFVLDQVSDFTVHSESPYVYYTFSSNQIYSYQFFTEETEQIDVVPDTVKSIKHYSESNRILVMASNTVFVYSLKSGNIIMGRESVLDSALDEQNKRLFLLKNDILEVIDMNKMKVITNLGVE